MATQTPATYCTCPSALNAEERRRWITLSHGCQTRVEVIEFRALTYRMNRSCRCP